MQTLRFGLAAALFLAGCSTAQITSPQSIPLYKNRADMVLKIDQSQPFTGMAVTKLPPTGSVNVSIDSQADLDILRITTCARDYTVQQSSGWWFSAGKHYDYTFTPTEREKTGVCPMYIEGISKDSVTDWGYIAWRTDETLPVSMDCNGTTWTFAGLSVCQTKAGLDQVLRFDRAVKFAADPNCAITQTTPQEYVVRGQMGFCYAEFSDGKVWHRLILLGYDSVLVR